MAYNEQNSHQVSKRPCDKKFEKTNQNYSQWIQNSMKQCLPIQLNRWISVTHTFRNEEVEKRDNGRVTTEHVIATCPHPLQGHATSWPYDQCPLHFRPHTVSSLCKQSVNKWN